MEQIVKKFVDYLIHSVNGIEMRIILNAKIHNSSEILNQDEDKIFEIANRQRVARIISIPESEWHYHAEVFNEFGLFSEYLNESPLSDDEKAKLSFYFIKKNIACGILQAEVNGFDAPKIREYDFKYITAEDVEDLIRRDAYRKLIDKDPELLTEHERLQVEDIKRFIDDNPLDLTDVINMHKAIKEHYFDKEPNLTKEDLQQVVKALYDFKFDKSIVKLMKAYIYRTCKVVSLPKKDVTVPIFKNNNEVKKEMLSKKEYYVLEQELKKYFDIENMGIIRMLSFDEEIYCIYLMRKMQLPKAIIENVLRIIDKSRAIGKVNPIEHYLYLLGKMKYYANNPDIANKLAELNEHFSGIFIADEDTYIIYKEYIRLLLDEVNDLIPCSYEYEFKMADEYELKLTR